MKFSGNVDNGQMTFGFRKDVDPKAFRGLSQFRTFFGFE